MSLAVSPSMNDTITVMTQEEMLDDSKGIPLCDVKRAFDFFPYGSPERCMLAIRFITGCRGAEMDKMSPKLLLGGVLYWPLGKKQRSYRKAAVPGWLLEEISVMRSRYSCPATRLFPIKNDSFRRYFNWARERIGGGWCKKVVRIRYGEPRLEYKYSLSGLRKDYQTLLFKKKFDEWGDAGVALEFTSKEMKHSSKQITAYHYIENFDAIGARNVYFCDLPSILKENAQTRIIDY